MTAKSIKVNQNEAYAGNIPEGAIRMYLSMGVQGNGQVKIEGEDPQPLYYGKNEYILATTEGGSYTIESEQDLDVVEDFVFMPDSIDAYVTEKINQMIGPMETKLADHEKRITALEKDSGGNEQAQPMPAPAE